MMEGELRRWCLSTSMKGIPRIIRSRSPFMKTIWALSVVFFISAAIEETVLLTLNYLSYPCLTSLTEYPVDLKNSSEMPDVTICNLNPFSGNASSVNGILTLEQYHNMVMNITSCESCTVEEQSMANGLRDALLTTEGYYINIGQDSARLLGHTVKTFIASCRIIILDGMHSSSVPCAQAGVEFIEYYDYMFYTCVTLHIPGTVSDYFYGYEIVLHLDNFYHEHHRYLKAHPFVSQTAGASLMFHSRSLPPVPIWRSIFVPTGSFSNVNLRFVRHARLPPPYGQCRENHAGHAFLNYSEYSNLVCFAICLQAHVYQHCRCRDDNHYAIFNRDTFHSNVSSCMAISPGTTQLQENWACVRLQRKIGTGLCIDACPISCNEIQYEYRVSYSTWPQTPYTEDFYYEYIAGRSYAHRYEVLREVTHENASSVNTTRATLLLNQNFLFVRIGADEYLMKEYSDVPQHSFSSFLAQLGGTLNLWAGITMVVFVELFEFLFELLWKRPYDPTKPDEPSKS